MLNLYRNLKIINYTYLGPSSQNNLIFAPTVSGFYVVCTSWSRRRRRCSQWNEVSATQKKLQFCATSTSSQFMIKFSFTTYLVSQDQIHKTRKLDIYLQLLPASRAFSRSGIPARVLPRRLSTVVVDSLPRRRTAIIKIGQGRCIGEMTLARTLKSNG